MTPGTSIMAKLFCVNAMRMEKGAHPRPLWAEKQLRILFRCPEQNIHRSARQGAFIREIENSIFPVLQYPRKGRLTSAAILNENERSLGAVMCAMKVYGPAYYSAFRCIAGACGHTCCEGWEIDIDPDSMERYRTMDGALGDKLRRWIDPDPAPHFILSGQERCPFLTDQNLCKIILSAGPDALCQICSDHPRFRNYWSDRIEIGLGMACEEAARLILTDPRPLRLVQIGEEPGELKETPSEEEIALRRLRDQLLASVSETGPAARLREYLIYRHFADALYDGLIEERIRLIDRAFDRITSSWNGQSVSGLIECARVFSNEVEYDDEKLEQLLTE